MARPRSAGGTELSTHTIHAPTLRRCFAAQDGAAAAPSPQKNYLAAPETDALRVVSNLERSLVIAYAAAVSTVHEKVEQAVRKRHLLKDGESLLVAVSGGLDSMALLHLLSELSGRHGWKLTVAHLNHLLRGRSSNADEHLVVRTARKLRLRAVVERADIRDVARQQNLSLEMAARQVRHEFLARTAARLGIKSVLLGHHADDQLELFFLRLFRGAGSEGLAGMKWVAPSPARSHIAASKRSKPFARPLLVRPLLGIARKELAEWVRENKIPFREDATNAALDIQRNRIRHELLPLLRRRYQPALDRTVSRLMEIAAADSEFVSATASAWLKAKRRSSFSSLPVAVQRRCLQLQLLDLNVAPDFELVENLRTVPGRRIMVSPALALRVGSDGRLERTILSEAASKPGASSDFSPLKPLILDLSSGRGRIRFGGLAIQWQIQNSKSTHVRKGRAALRAAFGGTEYFDAATLGSRLVLRHWQPGDRFQPIGMRSGVKLQDIFVNEKIPRNERHRLVILARDDGGLVWVEKLRISERFKLTSLTNRRLLWKWARI